MQHDIHTLPLQRQRDIFARYTFGVLAAFELLMSFTFLGYIHIDPISVTTAYMPVVVTACLLDVPQAAAVGAIFGAASLYKASCYYVTSMDRIFSPLQSGAPLQSVLLSVGTRALFGLLMGALFRLARRSKHYNIWRPLAALVATRLHSVLVFGGMGLFFPEYGCTWTTAFAHPLDDIPLALLCLVCVEGLYRLYNGKRMHHFRDCVNGVEDNPYMEKSIAKFMSGFIAAALALSIIAAVYFSQRASVMLDRYGVAVPDHLNDDLLHLQIQFTMAIMALVVLMAFLLLAIYRYISFQEYVRNLDALTGIMGRRTFVFSCNRRLHAGLDNGGWFLMLDLDRFKHINDTFGHPEGDRVLRAFARELKHTFADNGLGIVGRIGGDEFAVLLDKPLTEAELTQRLDAFMEKIAGIQTAPNRVTSSIGVYHFTSAQDFSELLEKTDGLLYQAKNKGRDGYVTGAQ